ncbi:hypothetical protein CJJ17_06860 [Gordonia polyisoprenivorans]|nr:hypothetical protein CJJ17_06860 [Gordonia polyisoprenivorans]
MWALALVFAAYGDNWRTPTTATMPGCNDSRRVLGVLVCLVTPCPIVGPLGVTGDLVVTQVDIVGVSSAIHLDLDDLDPE